MSGLKRVYCGIVIVIIIKISAGNLLSSVKILKQQFETFGEGKFQPIFNENLLKKKYTEEFDNEMYKLMPVNELKLAQRFSEQLEEELRKKMEALKKTVEFAENEAKNYVWNKTLSNVTFVNSKDFKEHLPKLVDHPLFKTKVLLGQSSVHIPTEIYEQDEVIQNTIKWTSVLTNKFEESADILRYQYFTSFTGVVMQYPGMVWRKKEVDMYDVRRRPWYVQGASSPKDVMILIDTSGSMHGISITLTKIAVQKLIDTMGENDYIAVAQFPGFPNNTMKDSKLTPPPMLIGDQIDLKSVNACFTNFVQASKRNKDRLFKQINQLKALGIADLEKALEFGIEQFKKFETSNSGNIEGSNCNKIILVLTDGGDDYDRVKISDLLKESNHTANIRIFIYSVGEEIAPIDSLKGITCDYRGFFGHIRSIGAVNNIIEKFVTVMHTHKIHNTNPLGENEFRITVSNVVEDGFLDPEDFPPKGLGLMTSLTMPVYNRSGNGTFMGLLGTDMTVDFINHLVPRDMLGPNGYAFAINTNGYIIFHPDLKVQRGWMRDPPNVDLIEVEFNSEEKTKIRKSIIDCAASNGTMNGEMDVLSFIKVADEIHTYEKTRKYAYHGIPLSTFGVTIVNPTYNKYYAAFNEKIRINKIEICNHAQCSVSVILPNGKHRNVSFSKEVFIYAENGLMAQCKIPEDETSQDPAGSDTVDNPIQFIPKSSSQILPISTFGSTISASVSMTENITMSSPPANPLGTNDNLTMPSFKSRFSSGLMKIIRLEEDNSKNSCPQYESRRLVVDLIVLEKFVESLNTSAVEKSVKSIVLSMVSGITLVYPEREKYEYRDLFYSSWNSAIFQRAFDMDKIIFYPFFHRQNAMDNATIVKIFKSFSVEHSNQQSIPAAVLGITVEQSAIMNILRSSDACNAFRLCYLLEDGGYVVSVSDPDLLHQVGTFFGDVHASIMRTLLNNSVFLTLEEFDYQASCPRPSENDPVSASNRVLQAITMFPFKVLQILLGSIDKIFCIMRLAVHFLLVGPSQSQEATAANNQNISCIKKLFRYYLPDKGDTADPVEIAQCCDVCNSSLIAQRFQTSNLLLVTFSKNCSSLCQQMSVEPLSSTSIKDPGPDLCALSITPNYRLRPKHKCYNFDPNEGMTTCDGLKLRLSLTTMLITLICKCLQSVIVFY